MIELRWVQCPAGKWRGPGKGFYCESTRTISKLQYRESGVPCGELLPPDVAPNWTEWKDVPVVEE